MKFLGCLHRLISTEPVDKTREPHQHRAKQPRYHKLYMKKKFSCVFILHEKPEAICPLRKSEFAQLYYPQKFFIQMVHSITSSYFKVLLIFIGLRNIKYFKNLCIFINYFTNVGTIMKYKKKTL